MKIWFSTEKLLYHYGHKNISKNFLTKPDGCVYNFNCEECCKKYKRRLPHNEENFNKKQIKKQIEKQEGF